MLIILIILGTAIAIVATIGLNYILSNFEEFSLSIVDMCSFIVNFFKGWWENLLIIGEQEGVLYVVGIFIVSVVLTIIILFILEFVMIFHNKNHNKE